MVKLLEVVENMNLKGGPIDTSNERYSPTYSAKNEDTGYECNDNCDCHSGDCSDCICMDCQR